MNLTLPGFNSPTVPPLALKASYHDAGDDNAFIDALRPSLSVDELIQHVDERVQKNLPLNDEKAEEHQRIAYAHRLSETYYELVEELEELYCKVDEATRASYLSRGSRALQNETRHCLFEQAYSSSRPWFDERLGSIKPASFSLVGIPGTGTSLAAEHCLSVNPQVIWHEESDTCQISYLMVNCEDVDSLADMCRVLLRAISNAIGNARFQHEVYVERSIASQKDALKSAMSNLNVGLLVIDSFEHISELSSSKRAPILSFLKSLNQHVSTMFISTPQGMDEISGNFSLINKLVSQGCCTWDPLKRFTGSKAEMAMRWEMFTCNLWGFHNLKNAPNKPPADVQAKWFECTQGVINVSVQFFSLCLVEAILSEQESIGVDLMDRVYAKHYWALKPAIEAIASNDTSLMEGFNGLGALSIVAVESNTSSANRLAVMHQAQIDRKGLTETGFRIYGALLEAGIDEEFAMPACQQIGLEHPGKHFAEAVGLAFKRAKQLRKKEVCSNRVAQKDWGNLPDGDLRKVFAEKGNQSMYESISQEGLLFDLTRWAEDDQLPPALS